MHSGPLPSHLPLSQVWFFAKDYSKVMLCSGPVRLQIVAFEQALLFGLAKWASRERASEGPLAASPLARAFSRDSFNSPKWESLLAGYLLNYLILVGEIYLWSCRRNEVLPNIDSFKVRVDMKYGNSKWRTKACLMWRRSFNNFIGSY